MKKLLILVIATGLFYACSNNPGSSTDQNVMTDNTPQIDENQMVIATDMENAGSLPSYWKNGFSIQKMDKVPAYSGSYAIKVTEEHKYSLTLSETFENLNAKLPKRVIVKGWYYFPEVNNHASVILDIKEDGESYLWKSFNLSNVNPATRKWNEFTAYFTIDKPINPTQKISIFATGANKEMYFDDFKIIFEY